MPSGSLSAAKRSKLFTCDFVVRILAAQNACIFFRQVGGVALYSCPDDCDCFFRRDYFLSYFTGKAKNSV